MTWGAFLRKECGEEKVTLELTRQQVLTIYGYLTTGKKFMDMQVMVNRLAGNVKWNDPDVATEISRAQDNYIAICDILDQHFAPGTNSMIYDSIQSFFPDQEQMKQMADDMKHRRENQ